MAKNTTESDLLLVNKAENYEDSPQVNTQSEKVRLSHVIDTSVFQKGQANIIVAPCGTGKTYAAIHKLTDLASDPERVLYLIDTRAGKDALASRKEFTSFNEQWFQNIKSSLDDEWGVRLRKDEKIRVMTYHHLGYKLMKEENFWSGIDLVICDEMHNLLKFWGIERSNNKINAEWGAPEIKCCETAFNELCRISSQKDGPLVMVMSATISRVAVALDKKNVPTEYFDYTEQVTRDKTAKTIYYSKLQPLLEELPLGQKTLVYVASITQMKKMAEETNPWLNTVCLWSLNSTTDKMTEHQLEVRRHILKHQRVPDNIDVLFINAAYETSLNINNEDFKTMIIHTGEWESQVQVRGRLRHDIDKLYIYDPNHEHISHYFPEEYYDRFLTSAETSAIAEQMNLKDPKGQLRKWTTIKNLLRKDGITVTSLKVKGVRGYILHKPA